MLWVFGRSRCPKIRLLFLSFSLRWKLAGRNEQSFGTNPRCQNNDWCDCPKHRHLRLQKVCVYNENWRKLINSLPFSIQSSFCWWKLTFQWHKVTALNFWFERWTETTEFFSTLKQNSCQKSQFLPERSNLNTKTMKLCRPPQKCVHWS